MRLGAYPCALREGTRAFAAYGTREICERHRHRYEFNHDYRDRLSRAGLVLSGTSPDGRLVEIVELAGPPLVPRLPVPPRVQVDARSARTRSSSPSSRAAAEEAGPGWRSPAVLA